MPDVFHIIPATIRWGTSLAVVLPVVLVLAVVGVLTYSMVNGARHSTFEVGPAGLRIRGDFYGRLVPASRLRLDGLARIDIDTGPYHPVARTAGTALPGYRAGWFRLRNGRKGLLYVTDPTRVVLVPTTADYDVLLSVSDPDRFIARLRALGGAGPSGGAPAP